MESASTWFRSFIDAIGGHLEAGLKHLPSILAAIVIIAIGWVLARVARTAIHRLALVSNSLLDRVFASGVLSSARVSSIASTVLGEVVFWAVLLLTFSVASGVAGLTPLTEWLDQITAQLPSLFAGVTIVLVGYLVSLYVRELVTPRTGLGERSETRLQGRLLQGVIVAAALIVGLDQIGVDVLLLVGLFISFVIAPLIGLAAAFALGARNHVSNLIGVRAARRKLQPGMRIRVADVEGVVLEFTPNQVTLDTDQGKVLVPGSFVDGQLITIIAPVDEPENPDE
jgi:hypothetical protein